MAWGVACTEKNVRSIGGPQALASIMEDWWMHGCSPWISMARRRGFGCFFLQTRLFTQHVVVFLAFSVVDQTHIGRACFSCFRGSTSHVGFVPSVCEWDNRSGWRGCCIPGGEGIDGWVCWIESPSKDLYSFLLPLRRKRDLSVIQKTAATTRNNTRSFDNDTLASAPKEFDARGNRK